MNTYVCPLCGFVYDPAEGAYDEYIEPGTPFEELPDQWCCPVCGASKEEFFADE
ncbi:MAG: rubredoxin [Desulfofustis sp.]|jgi:rubredoxin|nr:rubredoxin [Desulfofustis sp.]